MHLTFAANDSILENPPGLVSVAGTNVNTPFFQVPTPEFGHGEYKVETLYSGTKVGTDILGTQRLNTAPFCAGVRALVLGHQV